MLVLISQLICTLTYTLLKLGLSINQGSRISYVISLIIVFGTMGRLTIIWIWCGRKMYDISNILVSLGFLQLAYQQGKINAIMVLYFIFEMRGRHNPDNRDVKFKVLEYIGGVIIVFINTFQGRESSLEFLELGLIFILITLHKMVTFKALEMVDSSIQCEEQSPPPEDRYTQMVHQTPGFMESDRLKVAMDPDMYSPRCQSKPVESSFQHSIFGRKRQPLSFLERLFSEPPTLQAATKILERMIQRSFDLTPQGVILMNKDGTVAYANQKAQVLLGCKTFHSLQVYLEKILRDYYQMDQENLQQDQDEESWGTLTPDLSQFRRQKSFLRMRSKQFDPNASLRQIIANPDTIELILEKQGTNVEFLPRSEDLILLNQSISISLGEGTGTPVRKRKCIRLCIKPIGILDDGHNFEYTLLTFENKTHKQTNQENQLQQHINNLLLNSYSHELKTPLNCSQQYLDTMLAQFGQDQNLRNNYIVPLARQHQLLLHQIGDILDYAQLQTHKFKYNLTQFDLLSTIQKISDIYETAFAEKNIEFRLEGSSQVIMNDESRISQVMINLLNNALKFTGSGGHIEIRLEESRLLSTISVMDDGPGILPSRLKHIQKVLRDKGSRNKAHIGMGLKIASQIINGFVDDSYQPNNLMIESNGRGTQVSFHLQDLTNHYGTLRRFQQEKGQSEENVITRSTPAALMDRIKSKTLTMKSKIFQNVRVECKCDQVLLVDDVPFNLTPLKLYLDQLEVTYQICFNGQEALDLVTAKLNPKRCEYAEQCSLSFKLVLMDIQMPVMGGIQATAEIRSLVKKYDLDTAIVMCSAYDSQVEREEALVAGAQDFISKPVKKSKLLEVLQRYVGVN